MTSVCIFSILFPVSWGADEENLSNNQEQFMTITLIGDASHSYGSKDKASDLRNF